MGRAISRSASNQTGGGRATPPSRKTQTFRERPANPFFQGRSSSRFPADSEWASSGAGIHRGLRSLPRHDPMRDPRHRRHRRRSARGLVPPACSRDGPRAVRGLRPRPGARGPRRPSRASAAPRGRRRHRPRASAEALDGDRRRVLPDPLDGAGRGRRVRRQIRRRLPALPRRSAAVRRLPHARAGGVRALRRRRARRRRAAGRLPRRARAARAAPPRRTSPAASPSSASLPRRGARAHVALRASIVISAPARCSFRFLVRLDRAPAARRRCPPGAHYRTQPVDEPRRARGARRAPRTGDAAAAGRTLDVAGPDVAHLRRAGPADPPTRCASRARSLRLGRAGPLPADAADERGGGRRSPARRTGARSGPLMAGLAGDLLARDDHADALLGVRLHRFDAAVERALRDWEAAGESLAAR